MAPAVPWDRRREACVILRNAERTPLVVLGVDGNPNPVGRVIRVVVPLLPYRRPRAVKQGDASILLQPMIAYVRDQYAQGNMFVNVVTVFDFEEATREEHVVQGFFGAVSLEVPSLPEFVLGRP
jgi:hypothetical protein